MAKNAYSRRDFIAGSSIAAISAGIAATTAIAPAIADTAETVVESTGSQAGFGGEVIVTLLVDTADGTVVDALVKGDAETPTKGGLALPILQQAMIDTGTYDVDVVAGSTVTSTAVIAAAKAAWSDAMGLITEGAKMMPGSYTASAKSGYWRIIDLPVTVTVSEDSILDISVPEDRFEHGDTEVILESVKEQFFPRIIANQTINVDGVTGATLSCSGVRNAIHAALEQAFVANGENPAAVAKFERPVTLKVEGDIVEELDTDILIVGMSTGGIIAYLNAVETIQSINGNKPVSVIAIDRAGKVGGKSALTHEACAVNPKNYGAFDNNGEDYIDAEDFRARWKHFATVDGEIKAKEELIDLMVDESGNTVDWLFAHGWRYGTVTKGAGYALSGGRTSFNSVCTSRADPGTYEDRRKAVNQFYQKFCAAAKAQGAKLMLETEGYELIVKDGVCRGVKARNLISGREYIINAKAVIMSTGGYSANPDMINKYLDEAYRGQYKLIGTGCDTGLMIQSAIDNGAGTFNMGMTPILMHCGMDHWLDHYPFNETDVLQYRTGRPNVWTLNNIPLGCAYNNLSVAVKHNGKRFMDEAHYEDFSQDIDVDSFAHWAGGANYYVIVSDEELQHIAAVGYDTVTWDGYNSQGKIPADMPVPEVYEGMDLAVAEGMAWKASSLEELADMIDVDKEAFLQTMSTYNEAVANGIDAEFGKAPENMVPIATAPFYAIKLYNATFGTIGGLDVDTQMRVLGQDGQTPIAGLYAIGLDSMGCIHSPNRHYNGFGGVAQCWLQTGGLIASESAVDYVNKNYGFAEVGWALSDLPASF